MDYIIRPYRAGEEKYVARAHREVYSAEYNWGESFISYAEEIALSFPAREKSEKEELWVAEAQGRLLGCICSAGATSRMSGSCGCFLWIRNAAGRAWAGR